MEMHEDIRPVEKKSRIVRLGRFLRAHPEQILQCAFAVIIFILGIYRLLEIYMPALYNDEYGYWAANAFFMGDDWSSVTSRIPYYSYGYGLLLVPLRFLCRLLGKVWWELYQAAVILNVCMLIGSYLIACRLCKRYMDQMHWVLRSAVCFTAVIYTSNMVYSHLTWTENALYFFFWVFLYVLMRCIDRPSIKNHICLAVSVFYLYTIHQRSVAELIAAVMVVLYMKLIGENTFKQVGAFLGSIYLCSLVHAMIKGKLQNDFYLGNPPAGVNETISYALTTKALVLLAAGAVVLLLLYLQEKGKRKALILLLCICAAAGAVLLVRLGGNLPETQENHQLAVNDFSGQWRTIKRLFSVNGLLRLLISITGKWFYLASTTGLIVCWSMKDLIQKVFWMFVDSLKRMAAWVRKKEYRPGRVTVQSRKEDIWLMGAALSWMGSVMVCAIYKEGLYKVDDLLNGRYNEFVMGILIVYGFYRLLQDRHWLRTALICLVLYLLAGALCQYTLDELQRTDFELAHSVMLGRVFWNWEVPTGKVRQLMKYVLPLGMSFIAVVKVLSNRFQNARLVTVRCILALLIPACAWTYLARTITDNYTVSINERHMLHAPVLSQWIDSLAGTDEFDIYFLEDAEYYRWAEEFQFVLQDRKVTMTTSSEAPYDKDAFFITAVSHGNNPAVQEKCATVIETSRFSLLVSRGQELMRRLDSRRVSFD